MSPEEVARAELRDARRMLAGLVPAVIVELSLAAAFWPPPKEWEAWAAGTIGITILASLLYLFRLVRARARLAGSTK